MENTGLIIETINHRYSLHNILNKGGTALVCIVKKEDAKEENKLVAKIIYPEYTETSLYLNESAILSNLSNDINSNKYIFKLKDYGEGKIIKNGEIKNYKIKFLIFECAEKGELYDYYIYIAKPFTEKMAKLVFEKLIKNVQFCHNKGICHLDIKPENILLTGNYIPKLNDFGSASAYKGENNHILLLNKYVGSRPYMSPQIIGRRPYMGNKADIYSLGITLMTFLYPYNFIFQEASIKEENNLFRIFIDKNDINHEKFWNTVQKYVEDFPQLSNELKNLFVKMVSKNEKNRPNIEEILNDPWFDEIRNLTENEKNILIYNEFHSREIIKNEEREKDNNDLIVSHQHVDSFLEDRSSRGVSNEYFSDNLKPKCIKNGIFLKDFVKIKGELKYIKFMNDLANKLKEKNNCDFEFNSKSGSLKFEVLFNKKEIKKENLTNIKKEDNEEFDENIQNENEENEDDDENEFLFEMKNQCRIQIKLYQDESYYYVRFVKKSGLLNDYYKNLGIIKAIIKKIL